MAEKIRIGISGYGNLGRGCEKAVAQAPDMELAAVFTRRDPASLQIATPGVPVVSADQAEAYRDRIDVLVLCGGSATDLPQQGPHFAQWFHTVDSFDTHAKIPDYFAAMDGVAKASGHLSMISVGWDPGLFSLNRVYAESVLPSGSTYTFWGRGVSQGHSDAVRRVPGVKNAIQYTVPIPEALEAVRSGSCPELTTRQKHLRECWVVAEEGADLARIQREIQEMPNYFSDYDTTVHFISEQEFQEKHSAMPHGGFVLRSGTTSQGVHQLIEYSLKLDSNPEFTSSVLTAYARAAWRLAQSGRTGACTVLDVPPALLSPKSGEQLRAQLL